ncbi:hypothetical protein [Nocardia aurea]|uniref:Uncharacterized protein n=1 Tax=Nocardia aurea TaxID=2144174 RepID=A0ABV3FM32_9NOCA
MAEVAVRVVGLTWGCWKCCESTVCVLGLTSKRLRDYETGNQAVEVAKCLLIGAGKADIAECLAPSVKGIASHCTVCGAVQDNFDLRREARERYYWDDDNAAYDALADGSVDDAAWREIEIGEFPW